MKTQLPAVMMLCGLSVVLNPAFAQTWTQTMASMAFWSSVASSADGTKLVAVFANYSGSGIFTSTDSGNTWTSNNVSGGGWTSVASSADGSKLVAVANGGIWTLQTAPSPEINITPSNGNFTLSWTLPSRNFVLQQNLDLTTTNWVTLTTHAQSHQPE
jgi:hypothetical protein